MPHFHFQGAACRNVCRHVQFMRWQWLQSHNTHLNVHRHERCYIEDSEKDRAIWGFLSHAQNSYISRPVKGAMLWALRVSRKIPIMMNAITSIRPLTFTDQFIMQLTIALKLSCLTFPFHGAACRNVCRHAQFIGWKWHQSHNTHPVIHQGSFMWYSPLVIPPFGSHGLWQWAPQGYNSSLSCSRAAPISMALDP